MVSLENSRNSEMALPHPRRFFRYVLFLGLLAALLWPVVVFVSIQLRLRRNWPVSTQLAAELQERHPAVEFGGAASYKEEVIYVSVRGRLDEAGRRDVEEWLHARRRELRIGPKLLLRYLDEDIDKVID
jgi:hypothetical protein